MGQGLVAEPGPARSARDASGQQKLVLTGQAELQVPPPDGLELQVGRQELATEPDQRPELSGRVPVEPTDRELLEVRDSQMHFRRRAGTVAEGTRAAKRLAQRGLDEGGLVGELAERR